MSSPDMRLQHYNNSSPSIVTCTVISGVSAMISGASTIIGLATTVGGVATTVFCALSPNPIVSFVAAPTAALFTASVALLTVGSALNFIANTISTVVNLIFIAAVVGLLGVVLLGALVASVISAGCSKLHVSSRNSSALA